jgi:tRNA 5-methylaminomethyl-2-thiouridine biosynthesis bifunctional protein
MYSEKFQDIYFNEEGIEESQYVFIEGNQLHERFMLPKDFSVCELGFGTGLNFLLTAKIFLEKNQDHTLYYYSIEKYPLKPAEIQKALNRFLEISLQLKGLIDLFKKIYYPIEGFSTVYLHPRIRLTLMIGDVVDMLRLIPDNSKFDAWYLDGFAPSKNPEMWREEIYQEMARLSYNQTTFATFSSAGIVKRGLIKNGFIIQKRKGFKNKKEMLCGYFLSNEQKISPKIESVGIIGAGISGITTAILLLKRGYKVFLFDRNADFLQGSSGIDVASVMPYISTTKNNLSDYTLKSYNYLLSFLLKFFYKDFYKIYKDTLILKKHQYLEKLPFFVECYRIPSYCLRKNQNCFINKRGGIIDTKEFLNQIKIVLNEYSDSFCFYPNTEIIDVLSTKENILLQDHKNSIYEVDALVFCNSYDLEKFSLLSYIDYQKVRGQFIRFNKKFIKSLIKKNIIADISLFALKEKIYLGSSFEYYLFSQNRERVSDQYILQKLEQNFPSVFKEIAQNHSHYEFTIPTEAFVGFRCQSKDYLPVVGRLTHWETFIQNLKNLNPNKRYYYKDIFIPEHNNIFIHACHGTRGYTTSFLSSEIIASMIHQDPLPIESSLLHDLSPARFVFRKWRSSQNRKIFNL